MNCRKKQEQRKERRSTHNNLRDKREQRGLLANPLR